MRYNTFLMKNTEQNQQKAVLAGIYTSNESEAYASMDELAALALADDIEVCGSLLQQRKSPDVAFYIGKGKVDELEEQVKSSGCNLVIFDNELRSSHVRNLSKRLKCCVIDRSELILDIFASRARTKQATLQVEVARFKYEMSRLRKLWTHFGRIEGGIGSRGMGETQLEVDRRRTRDRVYVLEKELKNLLKNKAVSSKQRNNVFKVALVGYTNAGKSTLLNTLTDAEVFVKDLLFATLDTTTRKVDLDKSHNFILSDTVGFVRKLPHHLVASFHATLSEVKDADLLLHVVDISDPEHQDYIRTVDDVLEQIGAKNKDILLLFNKTDCVDHIQQFDERMKEKYGERSGFVFISAKGGIGLERLKKEIRLRMDKQMIQAMVAIPWVNGKAMAFLRKHGQIMSEECIEDKQVFKVKIDKDALGRLRTMMG